MGVRVPYCGWVRIGVASCPDRLDHSARSLGPSLSFESLHGRALVVGLGHVSIECLLQTRLDGIETPSGRPNLENGLPDISKRGYLRRNVLLVSHPFPQFLNYS